MLAVKPHGIHGTENERSEPSARDLAQVLDHCGEAVIIKDLNAVVTYWNREADSLYGFSAEQAIGQPLRKLHAAELSEADYASLLERVARDVPLHRPPSGEEERRHHPCRAEDEAVAGRARRVGRRDHDRAGRTAYRQTEEALRRAERRVPALCGARTLYRSLPRQRAEHRRFPFARHWATRRSTKFSWDWLLVSSCLSFLFHPSPGRLCAFLAGQCNSRRPLDPLAEHSMAQCRGLGVGSAVGYECGCGP